MNFYCDSQGVVFYVDAERIFQGSLGANKIRLIGQFPSTAQVLVAYELPDGTKTSPKIMTSVATLEQVQAPNGGLYSIWESLIGASPKIDDNGNVVTDDNGDVVYDLIPAITALYGTVKVQFFVYGASNGKLNGQVLAVASSSFTVEKGVPAEIPEFDLDDGTTLLQNILAVVANYETIVENAAADAQAAANSAAASASAAETALNGVVKKTGDGMSGPLLFNSPRTLNQALVSPNGLEVGVGVDGESVAVDKTEYGNGGVTKVEGNEIKSFALPEESGTLVTEETAREIANEEIAKFDFINIVAELPETGLPNRFYLVPKENGTVTDLFDAYIWVINDEYPDGRWEYEGVKSGEIDLTILKDYVKKTDYATDSTAGVARWVNGFGLYVDQYGRGQIRCSQEQEIDEKTQECKPIVPKFLDYATMKALSDCKDTTIWTDDTTAEDGTVTKGTKTKARELIDAVGTNDKIGYSKFGLAAINSNWQSGIAQINGELYLRPAVIEQIDSRTPEDNPASPLNIKANRHCPIVPNMLDYAVRAVLTDSKLEWTDEQKTAALNLLGAVAKSTGSADRIMLYGIDEEGNQITVGTSPSSVNGGMVPLYNPSGNINVASPRNGNQAANKYYVDEAVANAGGTKLYQHNIQMVPANNEGPPGMIITVINTNPTAFTSLLDVYDALPDDYMTGARRGYISGYTDYCGLIEYAEHYNGFGENPSLKIIFSAGTYSYSEFTSDTVIEL